MFTDIGKLIFLKGFEGIVPKGSVTCCFSNRFLFFFLVSFLSTNVVTPLEFIIFFVASCECGPTKSLMSKGPKVSTQASVLVEGMESQE